MIKSTRSAVLATCCATFASLLFAVSAITAQLHAAQDAEEQGNELSEQESVTINNIRAAFAGRDLEHAGLLLKNAKREGSQSYSDTLVRLDLIHDYLGQFWAAVGRGAESLDAVDELVIGTTRVAVVEGTKERVVLRVLGQNRRYSPKTMPPNLAVVLADRALADTKENAVFFAVFHLADKDGDRKQAARLLNEAQRAGVNVESLLDELASPENAAAAIDLPEVTPAMKGLLSPKRWLELRQEDSRVKREALSSAEQAADGRLQAAGVDQPRVVAFQTRLTANFGCRLFVQSESEGVRVGLFSAESLEKSITVAVPAGTTQIEIARQRGLWQCRLNGEPIEVELNADVSPRTAGNLGVFLPAGEGCTIAAIELRAR